MIFVERLEETLQNKGISQYKMCKDLGIGQSTISSWKKGNMPSADKIVMIVQYLEVSADWLLGIEKIETQTLTENEKELLNNFKKLSEREQIMFIGRIKEIAERYQEKEEMDSKSTRRKEA